jgi:hypothetical protein
LREVPGEMKQSPSMERIQENMQPGRLTINGFLGEDDRKLVDIIYEDHENITAAGFTNEEIADRMQHFTDIASKELGSPVKTEDIYIVSVDDHRGIIPCPFSDNFNAGKRNTRFENISLGKTIYWSDLNIHMIREHGFYEGKGSFFRMDTKDIAMILGLIK